MEREEIVEKLAEFLKENYYNELISAASENKKSIMVDFSVLDRMNSEFADYLLENPEEVFAATESSLKQMDLPGEVKLNIRFFNLPEDKQIRIRNIRAEHIGKLIAVDGIVKRASEIRPEVSEAIFQCAECGARITVIQTERFIRPPVECECGNRKRFKFIDQKLYDARWVTIEEPFEITSGERPSEIRVFLKEDLTSLRMQNMTEPGNRIKVVGVLKQIPKRVMGTLSRQLEIYIDANSVESIEVEWEELEITPEDEKRIWELANDPEIYSKFVGSIAPALYGMEEIKEAIALQLFGGEVHVQKDKSRVRGDIHILLVGDPSCLVADERVVMADGTIMKIGEMGSRHLQKIDYKVHLGMGWKVGKANRFHAYKKQPIIEIVTETGKSIKGTYNQPVLVVENRKQSWKRLDEVKIGNKVQVIPKIKCNRKSLVETNWKDYPYYHKSWHIKIPKFVDEDLAGLFGYFIADGWIQKRRVGFVVNKDEIDILSKIKNALKKCFDVGVNMYEYERANPKIYYYQIDRKHIAKLLSFLNEKRVPNCIFQSRNSVVSSFLRWLYEGDGSVFSKGHGLTSISLKSKHIELLRDVQILLLRFGIHSRIVWEDAHRHTKIKNREITSSPSGSLMIRRSESIIKFWQNIGFISKKKNNKLKQAVKYAKTHIHKVHKNRAEKIVKINKLSPQDVFDIEVPKYHRFVANGIVVHNTAKSVLMKVVSTLIPRGRYVSGKGVSVDWDDPIIYRENGSVKTDLIGNVIDKFYQTKKDGLVNVSNIQVPAFNFKDFKIEWKPVRYVYRHKIDEPLIKLTLRTNRTVKITPSHSIYTIENSSVMEKKASEIKEGDFILIPRKLPQNEKQIVKINLAKELNKIPENERKHIVVENGYLKSKFSNHKIPVEIPVDENLMRLLGYYVAEGSLHEVKGNTWKVEFDFGDNDNENIEDVKRIVKSIFNVDVNVNSKRESKGYDVTINDKIVFLIFKYILKVSIGAKRKKVPEIVFNSSKKAQLEFIKGWVRGDYGVTTSKELMSDIQYLLLLNNIIASFSERTIKRRIDFSDHISYVDTKVYELKSPKVTEILKNNFDISRLHGYIPLKIFNSEKILNLKKSKYKRISKSALKILFSRYNSLLYERLEMLAKNIGVNELSKIYKINRKSALQYLNSLTKKGYLLKSHKDNKIKYILSDKGKFLLKEIKLVKLLTSSDLGFVEIKKIEKVKPSGNFVYDLSVENCENFVAGFGGVCCHNTGAGLTATVVKDEEFLGGWVLEAGALVMCNKSLICIDEFEKIEKTDQIALHEAMEQNTISIAKASIVATLPAQTAILGGGNPKFGRFDPYLPIKEQIDIPETLLARFDLKFALRDIPNPEMDTKIAEYILKARHYGEEEIKPIIDSEFLKKYVAYARKNCHPKLSKDAGEEIKNFFVGLREKVVSEESPVPITLRQYEGLIRLAEASAKLHLRNIVTKEDAIRAVNLMKASLRQFGFDTETGKFDIDRLEGRVPAVERGKIRTMIDVIEELSKTFGNAIPKEEIVNLAKNRGMKEFDIEKILNELKNKGELFEPRIGIFQKM